MNLDHEFLYCSFFSSYKKKTWFFTAKILFSLFYLCFPLSSFHILINSLYIQFFHHDTPFYTVARDNFHREINFHNFLSSTPWLFFIKWFKVISVTIYHHKTNNMRIMEAVEWATIVKKWKSMHLLNGP